MAGKEITQSTYYQNKALTKIEHIRREIASVYRLGRTGKIDTSDMTKFIYCLNHLGSWIEKSDLEKRITDIEKTLQERNNDN